MPSCGLKSGNVSEDYFEWQEVTATGIPVSTREQSPVAFLRRTFEWRLCRGFVELRGKNKTGVEPS